MKKYLIILEWPGKFKTLNSFKSDIEKVVGGKVEFWTTIWHFLTTKKTDLDIDIKETKNGYKIEYEKKLKPDPSKKDVIKKLEKQIKDSLSSGGKIIVATDNDREWEAIAWEIINYFKLKDDDFVRMRLQDIEKSDFLKYLKDALEKNPPLDDNLISAAFSRAALDKMFWYIGTPPFKKDLFYFLTDKKIDKYKQKLKELLDKFKKENKEFLDDKRVKDFIKKVEGIIQDFENYKKNKNDLLKSSIGRVQLPMLALGVSTWLDNFKKIKAKNYVKAIDEHNKTWNIDEEDLKKVHDLDSLLEELKKEKEIVITSVHIKESSVKPPKPFNETSVVNTYIGLYGGSPSEIMKLGQKAYEGGYVSYFRSPEEGFTEGTLRWIKTLIKNFWHWLEKKFIDRKYKISEDSWHNAIHPVYKGDIVKEWKYFIPEDYLKGWFTEDNKRYFDLVFRRTVAAFMPEAKIYKLNIQWKIWKYKFNLDQIIIKDLWFYKIYSFNLPSNILEKDLIDIYKEKNKVKIKEYKLEKAKFQFSPDINVANFKKFLQEKKHIWTPSTYGAIFDEITLNKKYLIQKNKWKKLDVTSKGVLLYFMLQDLADKYKVINIDYTENMEELLDKIKKGKAKKEKVLSELFKSDFVQTGLYKQYFEVLEYLKKKWKNKKGNKKRKK